MRPSGPQRACHSSMLLKQCVFQLAKCWSGWMELDSTMIMESRFLPVLVHPRRAIGQAQSHTTTGDTTIRYSRAWGILEAWAKTWTWPGCDWLVINHIHIRYWQRKCWRYQKRACYCKIRATPPSGHFFWFPEDDCWCWTTPVFLFLNLQNSCAFFSNCGRQRYPFLLPSCSTMIRTASALFILSLWFTFLGDDGSLVLQFDRYCTSEVSVVLIVD